METTVQPAPNKSPIAVIDTMDDGSGQRVTVAPKDGRVVLRGWALDARARPFESIEITIGGAKAEARCTMWRPDVAAIYGSPAMVGFRIELNLAAATLGHHVATLAGTRVKRSRAHIPLSLALDVVPPLRSLPPNLVPGEVIGYVDGVGAECADHRGSSTDGTAVVAANGTIVVNGWAAGPRGIPHTMVYAELDGRWVVRGMSGYARPDVATALDSDRADYGYRIRIPAAEAGPGHHALRVLAVVGSIIGPVGSEERVTVVQPARSNAQ